MKYNMKFTKLTLFIVVICVGSLLVTGEALQSSHLRQQKRVHNTNLDRLLTQIKSDISNLESTDDQDGASADDAAVATTDATTTETSPSDSDVNTVILDLDDIAAAAGFSTEVPFLEKDVESCKSRREIKKCNETMCRIGAYIKDLYDYGDRGDSFISLNMYTLNLFASEDPSKLVRSMDLVKALQVQKIPGAPRCFHVASEVEKKEINGCFENEDILTEFMDAMQQLWRCRNGQDLSEPLVVEAASKCSDDGGSLFSDSDDTKVSITVTESS